ncbi:MAG: acetyltransferase ribosomal protein N-acetylase [Stygiobacter sp.]|nr:MAG: acetyltransferase ribosomal protein N-acetylase [Stygiobacter sp.]KAF0217632.1 MAG: acetyltransferase ribosomal protein [Ignavibacteria bacterium]
MNTVIKTERLELVCGNLELARAEVFNRQELSILLNADVPGNWPPPLNDSASTQFFLNYAENNPDSLEFSMWYIILINGEKREAIGNIGFKGKPDETNTIETGYSIMETHQKKGFATEAVRGLLEWAFKQPNVEIVIAETLTDGFPSQKVLKNNGFAFIGEGSEQGVIRFELKKISG